MIFINMNFLLQKEFYNFFPMRFFQSFFFFLFFSFNIFAQTDKPTLVVGIIVEGWQQKHIDLLWNYFESGGIKKITGEGVRFDQMRYNIVSTGIAADVATIMTGTVPYYHGITANKYYDRDDDKSYSILYDQNQIGIGTKLTYSAHNMLSSTFNDELMMFYKGRSRSYAVAVKPEGAIMMGGHTSKSVAWLDDVYLKWVTTGYYTDGLPRWADDMNINGRFRDIVNTPWQPLFGIQTYLSYISGVSKKQFEYIPSDKKTKNSSVTLLNNTPAANTLVTSLALDIVRNEHLGQESAPDVLMLQYTVKVPDEKVFSLTTVEKEDMYLRLDQEIQRLIKNVEGTIGAGKVLFFLTANQTATHSPNELGTNSIPAGYFSATRSMALLNTYLMALYGQERWVLGYDARNIFLNRQKIEDKKLDFRKIQQEVADFMLEFEGVQSAYTTSQLLTMGSDTQSEMSRFRNSSHKNTSGDVIITLLPGWLEVDDNLQPVGESNSVVTSVPLYFYGWNLKNKIVRTPYYITDIAPTLTDILGVPTPNAAIGTSMRSAFEQ